MGHSRWRVWFFTILFLVFTPVLTWAADHNNGYAVQTNPAVVYTYTVRRGDTLWALSRKFGVTIQQLIAQNHISNPDLLRIGETVVYQPTSSLPHDSLWTSTHNDNQATERRLTAVRVGTHTGAADRRLAVPVPSVLYCTLTAYTAGPESTGKRPGDPAYDLTSTGTHAVQGLTVAVDPNVIPYGTKLFIPGVGLRVAEDTGGAIVGNHVDVFYNNVGVARAFGVKRHIPVYVVAKLHSSSTF